VPIHVADNLTPAQVKAYRLMDNRSHDESSFDLELLGPELEELRDLDFDLELTGFDSREIDDFLSDPDADDRANATPPVPDHPAARLGDLWLCGKHRVLCGGARISEILGLKWLHVDLQNGVIYIVQRNWRGDIDDPKSKASKRPLTLGYLVDRYRVKARADSAQPTKWVFVRTDGSGLPLWDSGVRQALKRAATAEGCDFPGLGPHSFRRANITWRQEVGGSSIEASKIAGHSTVRMTEEYTKIQLTWQEELTRRIQERLASVGETRPAVLQ
jgi:integrase